SHWSCEFRSWFSCHAVSRDLGVNFYICIFSRSEQGGASRFAQFNCLLSVSGFPLTPARSKQELKISVSDFPLLCDNPANVEFSMHHKSVVQAHIAQQPTNTQANPAPSVCPH